MCTHVDHVQPHSFSFDVCFTCLAAHLRASTCTNICTRGPRGPHDIDGPRQRPQGVEATPGAAEHALITINIVIASMTACTYAFGSRGRRLAVALAPTATDLDQWMNRQAIVKALHALYVLHVICSLLAAENKGNTAHGWAVAFHNAHLDAAAHAYIP